MSSVDLPFEEQLLVFTACLAQRGLSAALELLNDRTQFRYTAMHAIVNRRLRPVCVFDRVRENRAYLRSAYVLEAIGVLAAVHGEFITVDCRKDGRLRALDGPIVAYCGLAVGLLAGSTRASFYRGSGSTTWRTLAMTNSAVHRFEYDGWNVLVELNGSTLDGVISGHADLRWKGDHKCRIALSGEHEDGGSAIASLSGRSRAFIDLAHETPQRRF